MDREKLQSFIQAAEAGLASVRSSLLIIAQTGDASDLTAPLRNLAHIKANAGEIGQVQVKELAAGCETALANLAENGKCTHRSVYAVLDSVAAIEAAVFSIPLGEGDFLSDISTFVDSSFDEFMPHDSPEQLESDWDIEEFEIDEETLDVFRTEADELLASISKNLNILVHSPGDQNALWEIRRNAHTFKGAAGIVGIKDASAVAHRMEDLLDKIVEMRREAVPEVVEFLNISSARLQSIVSAKDLDQNTDDLDRGYKNVMAWLAANTGSGVDKNPRPQQTSSPANNTSGPIRKGQEGPIATPIVRVSLDRLDDLLKISHSLLINHSALVERYVELDQVDVSPAETIKKLESLFETQRRLTDDLHAKLLQIRMVRFGNLETRLSRAVRVTCLDENKKAVVELENGDIEIDTQMIDALIEPMLHLLKNAVVHGIETPETRRMIGKPERGVIHIRIDTDNEALILTVTDDGGGISVAKLKERALINGIIGTDQATAMTDNEALNLIFDRGLTTADKIDLNAGRGVGMSIVKESVESRGGNILVRSKPQIGTTFTITIPLTAIKQPVAAKMIDPIEALVDDLPPLVLIVDDSPIIRRHNAMLVEKSGFRVITANNGADAIELLLSGNCNPDLILSDVEMPDINGWEFLESIKADENFRHIPVIMVTSLNADEHRERAISLGASDYLVKPLTRNAVERHVLDSLLQREKL